MVAWRLRKLPDELEKREARLRAAPTYRCPLCRDEVKEEAFREPFCSRCVESGENTPDECRLEAVNSAAQCVAIAGLKDKVRPYASVDGKKT